MTGNIIVKMTKSKNPIEYQYMEPTALCSFIGTLRINGIRADSEDFVEQYDQDPDGAEPYCCGDMRADPLPCDMRADPLPCDIGVLLKYNITESDYHQIAEDISEQLSFGCCGWCS